MEVIGTNAFEQFFLNIVGLDWSLLVVPAFCSILISFIAGVVDYVTPQQVKGMWVYLIIAIISGVLLVFGMPVIFYGWFAKVLGALLNIVVGLIFYKLKGQALVDGLANIAFSKIMKKAGE